MFAFPALGLVALRSGGPRRLRLAAVVGLGLALAFAVTIASVPAASRPPSAYGYADTVPRAVLFFGLTLGLPVLSATGVIRLLGGRFSAPLWPYVAAVLAAGFGWVGGVVLGTWLAPLA